MRRIVIDDEFDFDNHSINMNNKQESHPYKKWSKAMIIRSVCMA